MGMGMGGIQPLVAQLRGQGAFGNPYVNPALGGSMVGQTGMAQPATTQGSYEDYVNRPTQEVKMSREAFEARQQPIASTFEATPGQLGQQPNPYRPAGSGSPAGLSSILSGNSAVPSSSNSLNTAPNMGGSGGSGGPFPLQGQYGIVKMANGGLAGAAQNMADQGRDGDSMLVHMSPGEVKGLQALAMAHGGSLSINPDTGLVEASFLKRILPMVAGAGLMMIPGVGPLAAAGMVGGFETMRTGDIGKGLMAGLGAYGGAGLAGSLASTGATQATLAANPGVTGGEIAREMGTAGFNAPTMADKIGAGIGEVTKSPEALGAFGKQNLMNIGAASAPVLNDAMAPKGPAIPGMPEEDPRYAGSPYRYNLAPGFQGSTPTRPSPYYRPTGLGYAEGGDVMMAAGGSYDDEPMGDDPGMAAGGIAAYAAGGNLEMKRMSLGEGMYRDTDEDTASLGAYDAAKKRMEKQFAAANLKPREMPKSGIAKLGQMKAMAEGGLGSYSDGGRMLKGPGDGMSDDIPAMIGKKQPARLADGEFVVPADVVSHLGNGSTDAGAKKLYSMMDKVRTARTGKKKQAPAVKADKYMPA
jgi:hypothetical protein